MTPVLDPKKMISNKTKDEIWYTKTWEKGPLKIQRINDSYQIQCDIKKHKQQWHETLIEITTERWGKKKLRAIVIDPAYQETGCKFPYNTMTL